MVRFSHLSITLSNACGAKKRVTHLYTVSDSSNRLRSLGIEGLYIATSSR